MFDAVFNIFLSLMRSFKITPHDFWPLYPPCGLKLYLIIWDKILHLIIGESNQSTALYQLIKAVEKNKSRIKEDINALNLRSEMPFGQRLIFISYFLILWICSRDSLKNSIKLKNLYLRGTISVLSTFKHLEQNFMWILYIVRSLCG